DLPQVAQYLSVNFEAVALRSMFVKELIKAMRRTLGRALPSPSPGVAAADLLSRAGAQRRMTRPTDPHRVLAELPFPIYLTTNPDHLLIDALREAKKNPVVDVCPWTEWVDRSTSIFAREPNFSPTVDRPLVYHLFGRLEDPDSLVLTEE